MRERREIYGERGERFRDIEREARQKRETSEREGERG